MCRSLVKKILITWMLALVLTMTGCGLLDTAERELVICSSLPLNAGQNARAVSMRDAIQMAVDEVRTVTIDGQTYPLRHVSMDDTIPETGGWNTAQEQRNARAAIEEHGCIAYVGTYNSGAAKIAIPILNRVQMAMISPGNTYPGLTKPEAGFGAEPWSYSPLGPESRNYCRVVPADDLQAPAAARYAAQELGATRAFIFHDTELYGEGLAEIFAQAAQAEGIEVAVPPLGVGARTMNPSQVAQQILETEPDLVYFGGVTANRPGEVLRALRNEGYEGYFMGADGIAEDAFIEQSNAFGDGRVYASLVGPPPDQLPPTGQEWRQRYRNRFDEEPDAFAAPSYEATLVVIDAIERANLSSGTGEAWLAEARPAVLEAMKQTENFDGILGAWSFDENCDTTDTTISMNRVQGSTFQFVDVVTSE